MDPDEPNGSPSLRPAIPVAFRIGETGFGVGIGCGVGVGFGQPLNLGGIPGLNQVAAGLTSGLGGLSTMLGGAGDKLQRATASLGVQGLNAGFGCGVGIGYGFGAGLMLKPSFVEQVGYTVSQTAGNVMAHLTPASHESQPTGAAAMLGMPFAGAEMAAMRGAGPPPPVSPLSWTDTTSLNGDTARHVTDAAQSELMLLLIRQQNELDRLKGDLQSIKESLCTLHPELEACKNARTT